MRFRLPRRFRSSVSNGGGAPIGGVLVTLGLDSLGTGLVSPIVPQLVQKLAHLPPGNAAPWIGALIAAYAGAGFLFTPMLASLSDRFGRRPVLVTSVAGLGVDYVLMALAPSLWWLFVGRCVAGATAANAAAVSAYIADVTPGGDRAKRFGLIGAVFGAGFVIGPAVGGLLGHISLRLPFWTAAALALTNALYQLVLLPESLPREKRRPFEWARANPFGMLRRVAGSRSMRRLAMVWSCSWIGVGAVQSSLVLFTRFRFGWGPAVNGLVLAGAGTMQVLVEGLLLAHTTRLLGERGTAMAGYGFGALGYATLALAFSGWAVAPAVVLMGLGGLAVPSVRAMMSKQGDESNQGEMQGILTTVEGLTAIVAPPLTAGLFFLFTTVPRPDRLPGAPFLFAAAATVLAVGLLRKL